ncbi:ROK family transcriptional regulator [Kitasatospora sp. CB01950]|uniref:ROK family transcriptional regulator n=1 Tax=Kitasatospora sp. CB01950 TaxID=1703930 RepID=UPI00093D0ECD|nr:ROK family transcriptional regulator [Kitasatospora sp. CB01950]OKJ16171.1 ROK family transcriptional regulator [Kitasatospora sp. CB01950]
MPVVHRPAGRAPEPARWNRQRLRSNNEWLLLELLRTGGPSSRAQLARDTGLSKPTVSAALGSLETAGLVREAGTLAPCRGRTAVLYRADAGAGYVLGMDVGRARLRVAVADLAGRVVARRDVPNRARTGPGVADALVATARETLADAALAEGGGGIGGPGVGCGSVEGGVVRAVIGSPGVWDERRRVMRHAAHLPGWARPGLFDRIEDGLGMPVQVANDANLAALGEYTYGAGAGSSVFAYLLVGTGVGVGLVRDGELWTGAHGAAGEIGTLQLPRPVGDLTIRQDVLLEEVVAADAVVGEAWRLGLTSVGTAEEVCAAARAGDWAAREAISRQAQQLAFAVAVVAAVADPELLVLGGGLGRSADLLLPLLEEALHRTCELRPRVVASTLGEDAVLLGAVATALEAARLEVFVRRTAPA